jgi:bifunctional non-homologous end joining protein LigD
MANAAPATGQSLCELGYHVDGNLRYAGSVGTGWDNKTVLEMHQALSKLEVDTAPVEAATARPCRWSRRTPGGELWVEPQLVAEVAFAEWTPEGQVRQASFKGQRTDKPAAAITREQSIAPPAAG